MEDLALPEKEAMAAAAVDAMAVAVAVAACDPGRGNPSPAIIGTMANLVQEQTGEDLAVGVPDLSAVIGVVASLKMPLDSPVDATTVDGAEGAAASKYTGNGNDDGSDELYDIVWESMLALGRTSLHISVISIVQEKVADHLNEVGSKKRVYGTDFDDPYDTDSDVEYDYNTDDSVDKRNHASFTKKVLKELNEGRHRLVDQNGDYTCSFGCRMKDGRESSLANHANSVAMSNPKTFKERAQQKALAQFFFGDKLPDYSMKRKKNRY
ncbi:hypothetical protein ACQ4PT_024167 [Festuca glaucescens]